MIGGLRYALFGVLFDVTVWTLTSSDYKGHLKLNIVVVNYNDTTV